MTNEEAIEFLNILKSYRSQPLHIKDNCGECTYSSDGFCTAIGIAIEATKYLSKIGWINVKDKLPDKTGAYLTYCGVYDGINIINYKLSRTNGKWMTTYKTVSFWMPLPEYPN